MKKIVFSIVSGILLVLSFPPFGYGILAWVALAPLFASIRNESLRVRCALSFLSGIFFFMGLFSWINVVKGFSPVDFLLLGIYLGSYFACFGAVWYWTAKLGKLISSLCAAAVWVSLEYIRSNAGFMALPWGLLGHSQYRCLPVIQVASWTGVYGVSFLIVLTNTYLSEILHAYSDGTKTRNGLGRADLHHLLPPLVIGGLLIGYGFHVVEGGIRPGSLMLSVVQGNVEQNVKWNPEFRAMILKKYLSLTEQAARGSGTSMVVWPETAIPGSIPNDYHLIESLRGITRHHNVFLLVGSALRPKFTMKDFSNSQRFNSAFLLSPSGTIAGRYDKIRLLPFAEYLPGRGQLPWPKRLVSTAGFFLPGRKRTLFNLADTPFGVLICWENIFPDLFRSFVKDGAHFMVNITNEAWFGETAAPEQFLMMSVFRAVENRVAVVRCANTGISCAIGPDGNLLGKVRRGGKEIFVEGHATFEVPIRDSRLTFYTMYGDLFAAGCFIGGGLGIAMAFRNGRRERASISYQEHV